MARGALRSSFVRRHFLSASKRLRAPPGARWVDRLLFATWPGLLVLGAYVATLAPSVTGEDSGELITAAYHFGVPHPPGYPLWTLFCGVWTNMLPFGSVAWRANLFSAMCMAGAVAFMFQSLKQMRFRAMVAGSAAAACGLGTAVWSQSVIAEVYTLNLLLMAAIIWLTVRWHTDDQRRWLSWASFCFGLGMSNHHILGFAALGIVLWALIVQPRLVLAWRLAIRCVLLVALGLVSYVYLFWAARRDVPVRWGETSTLAGLWEHVSRGQYKSDHSIDAPIPVTAGLLAARQFYGLRWLVRQYTPYLVPLAVAGMVWLWRRGKRRVWFWWTLILGLCCGSLFLYIAGPQMTRQDQFVGKVFLTPLSLIAAVPLAAGLQWLLAALRRINRRVGRRLYHSARYACALLVVAIPLLAHWRQNNMRHYRYAHDHAENMLACMLPRAIVLPSGDHNTFPLLYLIHVEGRRRDVTVADKYGYIDMDLYDDMPNNPGKPRTKQEREDIEDWIIRTRHRPVYFTVKKPSPVQTARVVPMGILYHLLPEGKPLDTELCWDHIHYRNLEGIDAPIDHAATNILSDYQYALGARAIADGKPEEAKQHFEASLGYAWGIPEIYNNVASALAEAGMVAEAIGHYEQAARLDWRYGPARWNLAKIFKSLGKFDWAAKVFEDLTQATPGDFRPYGELGFLYGNHLNDLRRARMWWYESLRLNPHQMQIIKALAESEPHNREEYAAATSQPAKSTGHLSVSEKVIDFGVVTEGKVAIRTIALRNTGDGPLKLLEAGGSCSCVISALQPQTLAPAASIQLDVGLNTTGKCGTASESLKIRSDDPNNPTQSITLRARVVPELTADPSEVQWDILPNRPANSQTLTIVHHADKPFELNQVTSTPPILKFAWAPKVSATHHPIEVRPTETHSSQIIGTIEVRTSLPNHEAMRIPFRVALRMPVTIMPKLLYLGRVERGQRIGREVHIEAIEKSLGLKLTLRDDNPVPGLNARLHPATVGSDSWVLEMEMDGTSARAGVFSHTLAIEIEGYQQPLEVEVHGHVAE